MSKIILVTKIKREKGFLYFCSTDKNGFITIGTAKMQRGKKKSK